MCKLCCRYVLIICALSAIVFVGCKPKQKIIYSTTPVEDKAYHELFSDIITNEFSYRTFSAKLNIGLAYGMKSYSSKGSIRIVRDEAIMISIQPLFGVEMFRLYMNPDTLFLLDRMNKRYVLESISSLKEVYPMGFDYHTMESLFTNALFVSGNEKIENDDFRLFNYIRTSDQNYQLVAKDVDSGIDYSFIVNGDNRIMFTHLMQPEKNHFMQWEYHNFSIINNRTFPHKMNMTLTSASRKMDVEFLFSDIITDDSVQLSLDVPLNYSKTSISEVIKILSPKK